MAGANAPFPPGFPPIVGAAGATGPAGSGGGDGATGASGTATVLVTGDALAHQPAPQLDRGYEPPPQTLQYATLQEDPSAALFSGDQPPDLYYTGIEALACAVAITAPLLA
jgi:hypothetical protein